MMLLPFMVTLTLSLILVSTTEAQLDVNYYSKTCPNVNEIVRQEMVDILTKAPSLAGPFLRMHFHDCFTRGCDASVLLDSTPGNQQAEKDAFPNQTLRGYGSVDRVKAALEKACPGTVSCADIITLMARDSVYLSKGPFWPVELGRRDGRVSIGKETLAGPPPTRNITMLISIFASKGLSVKDLVVLVAGHTLGIAHCSSITPRLYNFTGKNNAGDFDPALDREYVARLQSACPTLDAGVANGMDTPFVEMDPGSFRTFDVGYLRNVARRRGPFESDVALMGNEYTRAYIERHAMAQFQEEFFQDFVESIIKMGSIQVNTGSQGEVRKNCHFVN